MKTTSSSLKPRSKNPHMALSSSGHHHKMAYHEGPRSWQRK